MNKFSELQSKINYKFNKESLLKEALTHSSYSNENKGINNNERLEFLGDAVLELCMSNYIIKKYNLSEGEMTKRRAQLVCEEALTLYAEKIDLSSYLRLGKGEETSGGRYRPGIIADAFEALLGAIFEDSNYYKAYEVFLSLVIPYINEFMILDYKSTLQEFVQSTKRSVIYKIIHESGPPHDKTFEVGVYIDGLLYGVGIGKSKLKAEQKAAEDALSKAAVPVI